MPVPACSMVCLASRTLPRLQRIPEMPPHRQHLRIGSDVAEVGQVIAERRQAREGGNVESTGPTPLPLLEVGEEGRTPLDFVEDGLGTELSEESPRILRGEAAGVGILQREVGGIRCGGAGEGGFSGLTGPGDDDHWIRGESPEEERPQEARNRTDWKGRRHCDQMNIVVYTWSSVSSGFGWIPVCVDHDLHLSPAQHRKGAFLEALAALLRVGHAAAHPACVKNPAPRGRQWPIPHRGWADVHAVVAP